jgi:hypothetical protein
MIWCLSFVALIMVLPLGMVGQAFMALAGYLVASRNSQSVITGRILVGFDMTPRDEVTIIGLNDFLRSEVPSVF